MAEQNQNFKPGAPPVVDPNKYQDLEGVTLKKLEFGLWYIEHKSFFYKLIVVCLAVIGAASWSYTIYHFSYYLARGMAEDELLIKEMVLTQAFDHDYVARLSAQPPDVVLASSLELGGDKYDLVGQIRNNNKRHWGEFAYDFMSQGRSVGRGRGFVLPDESKYVLALGQTLGAPPTSLRLEISEISWHRLKPREMPSWPNYRDERLKIDLSDVKFTPARSTGLSEKINISQLEFTASNRSAYSFREIAFLTLLTNRGNLVGANRFIADDFMSGESRTMQVSWPGDLARVDNVEVIPDLNLLDQRNYLKYETR